MRKALKGGVWLAFGVILASGLAKATSMAIYSNFGPGMSFDTNPANAYFVTGSSFPSTCPPSNPSCVTAQSLGVQFTPSANFTFDEAQVAVFLASGTNSLGVNLEQDLNGLPGSIISEFQVSNQMTSSPAVLPVGQGQTGVTLVQGSANPDLNAGTPYWLVLAAGAPDTEAAWAANSISDIATGVLACQVSSTGDLECPSAPTPSDFAFNTTPGSSVPNWAWVPGTVTAQQQGFPPMTIATFDRTAFEVDGALVTPPSTVPESGTLILMALGLATLLLVMARARAIQG